jgi:hypothetical protein
MSFINDQFGYILRKPKEKKKKKTKNKIKIQNSKLTKKG